MMMKLVRNSLLGAVVVLIAANLCFGHACDDPWRPDPSTAVGPTSGGIGTIAPPPPPPAPGEEPGVDNPLSPTSPGMPGADGGLANQLPGQTGPGSGGSDSPDNIVLIPETSQLKIVGKKGEFRTYIVNRSPRDLFAVKLDAISSAFDISVSPKSIRRLVSGEKDYFTIKLKIKGKLKSGKFPMDFKVSSRGTLIYEGSLGKAAKKKEKVAKENLGIKLKGDAIIKGDSGQLKVVVKNNIYNVVNKIKVASTSKYFESIVSTPESIKELYPGRETSFVLTLIKKKGVKPGKYDIRIHAVSSSRNVASSKIVTVIIKDKAKSKVKSKKKRQAKK